MTRILVISSFLVSMASAEGLPNFDILRHEVHGDGWIQLFDGSPVETDSVSGSDPEDPSFGFSASDRTGIGSGNSSIGISGRSQVSNIGGDLDRLTILTRLIADYLGDGPNRPGGSAAGELSSIIEFAIPVERMQWGFILDLDETPGFTQSSMVTVENVTAGKTLVSTTEQLVFLTELAGNIGDVIRVTGLYSVEGTAEAGVSGLWFSGAFLVTSFTIPEPASSGLLGVGLGLYLLAYRRGRR